MAQENSILTAAMEEGPPWLTSQPPVVGTVKIDGQNRLGHTSDAARRIRRRPTSKQGVMPWLLDGAAPPLSESWADRPDAGEASGGGGFGGGAEVSELGRDEVAVEGTPAR